MTKRLLEAMQVDTSDLSVAMTNAIFELALPEDISVHVELRFKHMDVLDIIREVTDTVKLEKTRMESVDHNSFIVYYNSPVVIGFYFREFPLDKKNCFGSIYVSGEPSLTVNVARQLKKKFFSEPDKQATWFYQDTKGNLSSHMVELSHHKKTYDEFYPWIRPNLRSYYDTFQEDDANVLLLIGEPGTGKTTFIRDMIQAQGYSTLITHDSALMDKDQLFINFLCGDNDLLVLEDADILLHKREEGNKVMTKLLNAADGLIRTRKKIVLTANITHIDEVDSALIRPGRCFDVLRFREFTVPEARIAARAAGLVNPDAPCTLANLFKGANIEVERKIGF